MNFFLFSLTWNPTRAKLTRFSSHLHVYDSSTKPLWTFALATFNKKVGCYIFDSNKISAFFILTIHMGPYGERIFILSGLKLP